MEVKCIDADNSFGLLSKGVIYKVHKTLYDYYIIIDNGGCFTSWPTDRFEIVTPFQNFKVKCINSSGQYCFLTLGKIYEVCGESVSKNDYLLVGEALGWMKSRFEKVDDNSVSSTTGSAAPINDHVCPTCKNDKCSLAEVTCWKCGNPL